MTNIKLTLERPWLLLIAIPALLLILIPYLRSPKMRRRTARNVIVLTLHTVIAIILVLMISGLSFTVPPRQSVMIVADLSFSTSPLHGAITDHAERILSLIDSESAAGVVVFARNRVCVLDAKAFRRELSPHKINAYELSGTETDIAGAIEYAASLLPDNSAKRIILLSDGKQTIGDAEAVASALSDYGIRIDATYFDTTERGFPEVQLGGVAAKHSVFRDKELSLSLDVRSSVECGARITVLDNGNAVIEETVGVKQGSNAYTFTYTPLEQGFHSIKFVIEADVDTVDKNNEALSYLYVKGKPSVLLITNEAKALGRLTDVISSDCEITVCTAKNAPIRAEELCRYNTVILANASAAELPSGFGEVLRSYVSEYGGNLLTVGGRKTYAYGSMMGTVYEDILPVSLSLSEHDRQKTYATVFLIDCSLSMVDETALTTKLQLAKQGTVYCIDTMKENVSVGLVAFGQEASVRFPLTPMTDEARSRLSSSVSSLGILTGSGTAFRPALSLAYSQLAGVDADVKHIILVSDGEPRDRDFFDLITDGRSSGITASTIGLGEATSIMASIAESGGGIFHHVPDITELPEIMLRETEMIGAEPLIIGQTRLSFGKMSDIYDGLDSSLLPTVGGYIGSTLKEGATEHIVTSDDHPMLTSWELGRGSVMSFMSDLTDEWCAELLSSDGGQDVIRRMLDSAFCSDNGISLLSHSYELTGDKVIFTASTPIKRFNHSLSLALHTNKGDEVYTLSQSNYDAFSGVIELTDEGVYPYTLTYTIDGNISEVTEGAIVIPYSSEYDAFAPSGRSTLVNACRHSSGIVTSSASYLASVRAEAYDIYVDPIPELGILLAILFMIELALRKLSVKDFLSLFRRRR